MLTGMALARFLQLNKVFDGVGRYHEVIRKEYVAKYGVEVDENDGQYRCQQDGLVVSSHATDHVLESLKSVYDIKELSVCTCICMYM